MTIFPQVDRRNNAHANFISMLEFPMLFLHHDFSIFKENHVEKP